MKITQITVSYGATQSLPEYSNCKPSLTLTAILEDGEDVAAAETELWALARSHVHEQIDSMLEFHERAAKYDPAPRYQVMRTYWNEWDHRNQPKPPQYVVILPNEISLNGPYSQRLVHFGPGEARKLRYAYALGAAQRMAAEMDATLLDCSDGDLTPLNLALAVPEPSPDAAPEPESPF